MSTQIIAGDLTNGASISSDTTGSLLFQTGPAGAKVNALSIAADGTPTFLKGPVNVVAFSYSRGTDQAIGNSVDSVGIFNTVAFDTTSAFNTGTGRFQPTIAGYYQINLYITCLGTTKTTVAIAIRKNSAAVVYSSPDNITSSGPYRLGCTCLVYMNGSTDFIDGIAYITAASGNAIQAGSVISGILIAKA